MEEWRAEKALASEAMLADATGGRRSTERAVEEQEGSDET